MGIGYLGFIDPLVMMACGVLGTERGKRGKSMHSEDTGYGA